MNISASFFRNLSFFGQTALSSVTEKQKKIAFIFTLALSAILATYSFMRYITKKISPLNGKGHLTFDKNGDNQVFSKEEIEEINISDIDNKKKLLFFVKAYQNQDNQTLKNSISKFKSLDEIKDNSTRIIFLALNCKSHGVEPYFLEKWKIGLKLKIIRKEDFIFLKNIGNDDSYFGSFISEVHLTELSSDVKRIAVWNFLGAVGNGGISSLTTTVNWGNSVLIMDSFAELKSLNMSETGASSITIWNKPVLENIVLNGIREVTFKTCAKISSIDLKDTVMCKLIDCRGFKSLSLPRSVVHVFLQRCPDLTAITGECLEGLIIDKCPNIKKEHSSIPEKCDIMEN